MTVNVSNTILEDTFDTWRRNTNLLATIVSNNVVTVSRAGAAERGGAVTGNGHVSGTFSATNLRTSTLKGGNTTSDGALTIASNTTISGRSLTVAANTTFTGNVNFNSVGTDRIDFGDISRWRLTGGSDGQILRFLNSNEVDFVSLSLKTLGELTANSSNFTLSGANTSFSENLNSPHLIFAGGTGTLDRVEVYLAGDVTNGNSDLNVQLADNVGDSKFIISNLANTEMASVDSFGDLSANNASFSGNLALSGSFSTGTVTADRAVIDENVTANTVILPGGDVQSQIDAARAESVAFAIALG
jgi:hypothetical protein